MGNSSIVLHKGPRSNLRFYLEGENQLGLLSSQVANLLFVDNLNKMNAIAMTQGVNVDALRIDDRRENERFAMVKLESSKYVHMMNNSIEKNSREGVVIDSHSDKRYEEMLNAYEEYYSEIINCNEKQKRVKGNLYNAVNASLNSSTNELHSFENYNRPESAKEMNYSSLSSTITAAKVLNNNCANMNTISTSSNTITNSNKLMKVMKIGKKEEFVASGSKEKNGKRYQRNARGSPIKEHYPLMSEDNNLNTIHIKSPNSLKTYQSIEVKEEPEIKHQPVRSNIHQPNKSVIVINKGDNNRICTEKSLSPRQKYSLQIPLPKQKKTSISPPNGYHMSINTTLLSSPFEPLIPLNQNSNNSSVSASTSSYVTIMKQKQKLIKGTEFTKDNALAKDKKASNSNITVQSNSTKTDEKEKAVVKENNRDSRPLSKPKITFELDLCDEEDEKHITSSDKPTKPKASSKKEMVDNQTQNEAQTQRSVSPFKAIVKSESMNESSNMMVYKNSEKLKKLKDLKNKQSKQPCSISINIATKQCESSVNDNLLNANLNCIKEGNEAKAILKEDSNSSNEKCAVLKPYPSTPTFEQESGKDKQSNTNPQVTFTKPLSLRFKVNSQINTNAFKDISFLY